MSATDHNDNDTDVSVILVNYNTAQLLPRAIGALINASNCLRIRIIIVDNASRDDSVALIRSQFPDCLLIANENNVGFGRANNQALSKATGRYVLLLNTDAFVEPETLVKTITYMDTHPQCGILGVRLVGEDGTPQPAARSFPTPWNQFALRTGLNRIIGSKPVTEAIESTPDSIVRCDWVTGCYFLVRKSMIDQVGFFDPRYFLYYEEVDLCLAAKNAGWEVICYLGTTVTHIGGESARSDKKITPSGKQIEELQIESELLFFRKHNRITGLCLNVMLVTLSDVINLVKKILKLDSFESLQILLKHTSLVWSLVWRTKFGTQPTR